MELTAGSTILHYRLAEAIGEGGMGAVWRATDEKLGRDVALKVLPEAVAGDPERRARFEREAKVLASLNHPNVATLFGLEEVDGHHLLVMELVEGEDLAARIERGPLALDDALPLALQIAEGLEAAHEQGVVHRDLKPANVMIGRDGAVKVLDFGLATAFETSSGANDLTHSPTLTAQMTQAGVILGTAAYMSPEQARGLQVDKRTDIWAFGVVLYQMLSGESAFGGETVTDILAAIVKEEPDWERVSEPIPSRLRRLLDRMLEKDPRRRLRDIGEARITIRKILDGGGEEIEPPQAGIEVRHRSVWPFAVGALFLSLVAAGLTWWLSRSPTAELPLRKFALQMEHGDPGRAIGFDPRVSPDGRHIVFASQGELWLRDLSSTQPHPLSATEGASRPFWSPDSEWIGFAVDGAIKKVDRAGGKAMVIAAVASDEALGSSSSAAWGDEGIIVFGTGSTGLLQVSARGGTVAEFVQPDEGALDIHHVCELPDSRGWIYIRHDDEGYGVLMHLSRDGDRKVIHSVSSHAVSDLAWSPSGHIVFDDEGPPAGIWALPFSLDRLESTGDPFLVAGNGRYPSISKDGTLVYVAGLSGVETELVWVDRNGEVDGSIAAVETTRPYPNLSPDGGKILLATNSQGERELKVFDTVAGTERRLSLDGKSWGTATWHPDGQQVLAYDEPEYNGFLFFLDGRQPEPLEERAFLGRFSPDGDEYVYAKPREDSFGFDIWRRPVSRDGAEGVEMLGRSTVEWFPVVSPDGRFMLYASDESGRHEVYLTTYPNADARWQVSRDGGDFPRWRGDGREIFFTTRDQLWVVDVDTTGGVTLGRPRVLFDRPTTNWSPQWFDGFDVTEDGQRFVMIRPKPNDDAEQPSIIVTQNWFREFSSD